MSAATQTRQSASPARYQLQQQQLEQWAERRAEQMVFCRWIAEQLGCTISTDEVRSLVTQYSSSEPPPPPASGGA